MFNSLDMATPNESSTLPNLLSIEEEEVENNSDTESVVKWDSLIYEEISTLHWCSDDQITEGVLRFRVLCLPHLVYPSVGRVALFQVDSIDAELDRGWDWCRSRRNLHTIALVLGGSLYELP